MTRITILAHDRGTWRPEPEPEFTDPNVRVVRWSGTVHNTITTLDFLSPLTGVIVPLYEADVLPVGIATDVYGVQGLSWLATVRTVDRLMLRCSLDVDLSPSQGPGLCWDCGAEERYVCKARSSCAGSGVVVFNWPEENQAAAERAILGAHEEIFNLNAAYSIMGGDPFPDTRVVYERYIDGQQYEVSGVVAEPGDIEIWEPLRQHWVGGKILGYEQSVGGDEHLKHVAARAVANLGLSWCGFCVEVRRDLVIEVNARLGDDGLGYDALLRGDHPTRYHRMLAFFQSRL